MNPPVAPPSQFTLATQCWLLGHELRIGILRELCKGQALPVGELARRLGCTGNAMSKQMAQVETTGLAVQTYGRLYVLAPHLLPPAGATVLDLGQLVLKLTPPT